VKRYWILAACVLMLPFLGTGQAWSAFIAPLRKEYGFTEFQTQLVFSTATFFFCFMSIVGGRLYDRLGPRPVAAVSAVILAAAWFLAAAAGSHYVFLWLAIGVMVGTGAGIGYVCPIATAMKWFPRSHGLASGLAATGFACGPILLSALVEVLVARGWHVLSIFRLIGCIYPAVVLALGMLLMVPPGQSRKEEVAAFRHGKLLTDSRFWTLSVGMFCGTLPFLTVIGGVKPIAVAFGVGVAAVVAIAVMSSGNAFGRIFWGFIVDRVGPRRSILSAQSLMVVSMLSLILVGSRHPAIFLATVCVVGFCYGSNFAIYPTATAKLYGTHVLGSVYPMVIAGQGIAASCATLNGFLFDRTGSFVPGLSLAAAFAALGVVICAVLIRPTARETASMPEE
jgi:OFA family oxalate/formate antiporter-like MFS transporter